MVQWPSSKNDATHICYICNLGLKNRQASASDFAGLYVEIGVSVTAQTVRGRLHDVNLYGRRPRRKPLLTSQHKTAHGAMNASLYTQINTEKTTPTLKKLGRRGIFQQHTAKIGI